MLNRIRSICTKAAIYARTAVQCQDQLDVQINLCRKFARLNGWMVPAEYVFTDFGVGSALHPSRSALLKLLVTAKQRPRPFDYVVVEGLSRLERSLTGVARIEELFEEVGVLVYFVDQHIDARHKDL